MGRVLKIFICPEKGMPMQSVSQVHAIAGVGLEGDRYALGTGAYSKSKPPKIRHATLISLEEIYNANLELTMLYTPEETRRNIVVFGVSLNSLVGQEFLVDEVRVRGVELCEPCDRPDILSGKKGFKKAFTNRGGLRIEILSSGIIRVEGQVDTYS